LRTPPRSRTPGLSAGRELNPLRTSYKDAALTVELPARASALAASESNRALPTYQVGPFDRLGRGQRKTGDSNATALTAARFPAGASRLTGSSSEEGGRLERHRATGASLSGRARTPVRFTFREYRPGDSNPDRQVPGTCASANWARTAWSG
jgi:hypothetical protein